MGTDVDRLAEFRKTYFEECADLLMLAESCLAGLGGEERPGADAAEDLNALFRAVHSIKGGAGAFGFERLVRFAHIFESVLDALRNGQATLDRPGHALLLRALDMLSDLVRAAREDLPPDPEREDAIAAALAAWRPERTHPAAAETVAEAADEAAAEPVRYRILFAPSPDLFHKANEPLLLVRELKRLGPVETHADLSRLPALSALDPETAYLAWTFEITTTAGADALREVFEFVADDARLEIARCDEAAAGPPGGFATGPAALAPSPAADRDGLPSVAGAPAEPSVALVPARVGTAAAGNGAAPHPHAAPNSAGPTAGGGGTFQAGTAPLGSGTTSIRVDLERIDRLVNMVGEIVITQAMLMQQVALLQGERHRPLLQGLEQMAQHTRELQDCVMSIRAQPVKSVFARLPRLVRELAGELHKEVRLVMSGESTEVDKTVIEQLSDPLIHMVRNSVDHGIEPPEQREQRGKPREGTILLSAEHHSGRIVIVISDDGAGIDRRRVRQKCIERGLLAADAELTDEEIDSLIFLPGLSTAETVSKVSGRGVGMDVVKRNINALGGRVHVHSTPGKGSRFTLSLPLTLAVLDGMIVTVGSERYVVPLTSIIESLRPQKNDVSRLVGSGDVLAVRGEYVRLIYLHQVFAIADAVTEPSRGLVVLVESEGGEKIGLVVDELLGQQQVVIKSLETNYRAISGISAATILGDGCVALILDVDGLRRMAVAAVADHRLPRGDRETRGGLAEGETFG